MGETLEYLENNSENDEGTAFTDYEQLHEEFEKEITKKTKKVIKYGRRK